MSPIPKIFISAASGDLGSVRQVIKEALLTINCHPVEQTNFGPDARTVSDMLASRIGGCQALIHICGMRYGAEPDPATLPPGTPRRSYTQMEYHIGRRLQEERGEDSFRVYTFICPEDFPYDTEPDSESEEKRGLQQAHRQMISGDPHLREKPHDIDEIRRRILALQEQVRTLQVEQHEVKLEILRSRRFVVVAGAAGLLALSVIGVGIHHLSEQNGMLSSRMKDAAVFDPEKVRARANEKILADHSVQLAAAAREPDWRKRKQVQEQADADRDFRLAMLDRLLESISRGYGTGEVSAFQQEFNRILGEQGITEALAYLESVKSDIKSSVEKELAIRARVEEGIRTKLRPLLDGANSYAAAGDFSKARDQFEYIVAKAPLWPEPHIGYAWFLLQRALRGEPDRSVPDLQKAENLCRRILSNMDREAVPVDWALAQNSLGNILVALGDRLESDSGMRSLREAKSAYQSALGVFTRESSPRDWADTQAYLGVVLEEIGKALDGDEGRRALMEAKAAYENALIVRTRESDPKRWAITQNNLGNVLSDLAKLQQGDSAGPTLKAAKAAYESALTVRTRESFPLEWAMTQNNLGSALYEYGNKIDTDAGRKALRDSKALFENALTVHSRENHPQAWADSQLGLGNVLCILATRLDVGPARDALREAVAAFENALTVRTRDALPQDWAATQCNLGVALRRLSDRQEGTAAIETMLESKAAFDSSLTIFSQVSMPQAWNRIRSNLNDLLAGGAYRLCLAGRFSLAEQWARQALEIEPSLFTNVNLAHALLLQGKSDAALAIYRAHWDDKSEVGEGRTFQQAVLADFKEFAALGLGEPELARARLALGVANQ